MKRIRRLLQGSSRGLTLVEVVIAVALLGVIAVAYMGALSAASEAVSLADQRTTAESLARSQMEYVKNQQDYWEAPWEYRLPGGPAPPWDEDYVIASGYDGYIIHVEAQPLHAEDDGIQRITVVVSHITREGTITLEGYRRSSTE